MSEYFEILGGKSLQGDVYTSGSKNAAFPVLAATLLLSSPVTLNNVPDIEDIRLFINILKELGVKVEYMGGSIYIDTRSVSRFEVTRIYGSKIRASYYFLGALLARLNRAIVPYPGGCNVGNRPMDLHISLLESLGVKFTSSVDGWEGEWRDKPGRSVVVKLPFPSRGATVNLVLATVTLVGTSIRIVNANLSPETRCLISFLNCAGAHIEQNESILQITGVARLEVQCFDIIPDKIEAATLIASGLITRGEVRVFGVVPLDIKPFLSCLKEMGIYYKIDTGSVSTLLPHDQRLSAISVISSLEPHKIDADFEPILLTLLTMANGSSIVEDCMNPERHARFVPQLIEMGANIEMLSSTKAIVHGETKFQSHSNMVAKEIRGGIALMLAALSANGISKLHNIAQIDRGYEKLELKLASIGAQIRRISTK